MKPAATAIAALLIALPLVIASANDLPQDSAQPAAESADWPVFRGDAQATGVARTTLPENPRLLWSRKFEDSAFETAPVIVEGVIYVGDYKGVVHALKLGDGSSLWKHETGLGIAAAAAVREGRVYVGDIQGKFVCLSAEDGTKIWETEAGAEINGGANFHGLNVLFGSQDATLYCLNALTGESVWEHQIADQIRCSPTIVEGRAFLAGCDGKLHIIDVEKGTSTGDVAIDAPTGSTPAAVGDFIYFGTEGGTLFCINWKQAEVAWKYQSPRSNQPIRSSAAVHDGLVVFGSRDRQIHALDAASGDAKWTFPTRGQVDGSPVIVGERAFIGSADGRLYGLSLANGENVWTYDAGGRFIASPAVAESRLVIGSDDGTLYCFGE
ncbi:MAG: PQQ-binding-like beta-propeller repeat protein [Pirellulales bacterium]